MSPGRLYDYVLKITSAEGLDSSDGSSDDEAVNVVSALVRVDGLQVHDVPDQSRKLRSSFLGAKFLEYGRGFQHKEDSSVFYT